MTAGAEWAVSVVVEGRVQGVGFRAWVKRRARELGLSGHVRNRRDGAVEAVFSGPEEAVSTMIDDCRRGPVFARVDEVTVNDHAGPVEPNFLIRND